MRRRQPEILEARRLLAIVDWTGGGDGTSWSDPANWSSHALPGPTDDVVINAPAGVTVAHASGADSIHSLVSSSPLDLSGGTLTVSGTVEVDNTFTLDAGATLAGATVKPGSGGQGITATGGKLDGVTLDANLSVAKPNPTTIDFENFEPLANPYYDNNNVLNGYFTNNAGTSGDFTTNGTSFNNNYDSTYDAWYGWAISSTTDTTNPDYTNQYSAITGGGADGSKTYAVAYTFGNETNTNPDQPGDSWINLPTGVNPSSIQVTNTTYAYLSMKNGDQFENKFGPNDYLELDITGYNAPYGDNADGTAGTTGSEVGEVTYDLAKGTDILNQWHTIDLSSLAGSESLVFSLRSSQNGDFGINTPTYFAVDNLVESSAGQGLTISDGLKLNGTLEVGDGNQLYFNGSQTVSGSGQLALGGNNAVVNLDGANGPMTLTVAPGTTLHGTGQIVDDHGDELLDNQGTIEADVPGGTLAVSPAGLTNEGTLAAVNGGTLSVPGVSFDGASSLNSSANSTVIVTGNLLGTVTNPSLFTPVGTTLLDEPDTSSVAPELLEAMSQDLGAVAAGFINNFAYGTLAVAPNGYVRLVDRSVNSGGGHPEAVYANEVVVPAGATLDLNGLHLYTGTADIAGTVINGSIDVLSAPVIVWNNPRDITYGALLGATQLDAVANVPGSFSYTLADGSTPANGAALHAGQNQTLNVTFTPDGNDATITAHVGINVTPAPLTITADDQSKVYGAALPTLTASYSGFVNGDTAASFAKAPTLSTTATAGSHVSGNPYTITASGAVDNDYTISYVAGALTVTPALLSITADDQSKLYGAALPTLTASYAGFVNGDTAANLATAPALSTTATASSHVSGNPYTITASGAVDADYTIRYVAGALTVDPVSLTITADDKTEVYGAALPTLTASYSGFVNGDGASSLMTPPTLTTTATAASHVSGNPYTITASGAVDADYTISYQPGSLTVTPAALTITADDKTKVYGDPVPTLTASYSGFVNGDSVSSLTAPPTLTTTATAASHVSGNPYTITASGAVDSDYTISYVAGALTVTPAALTITADDKTKVYGDPVPTLTASYSGFVNGDNASSLTTPPTLTTTATAASHVSGNPYTITASGAVDSDYTISYQPGSLTVTPATLTITADDQTKVYGAALPTLTASYSGLVNGDTDAVVTTAPTLMTTATTASHVSGNPYTITASGAVADADYAISYVAGALTVTPAGLTITADDQSKLYGAALPALTASYSGFVNGDSAASLTTPPTITTTATAASHVSGNPYIVTANGAVDSDYTISYQPGSLTVTPATLTITADDQTKVYGAALPTLTASYAGFVNGDTDAVVTTAPTLTTTATTASHVSGNPYTITASGAVADSDYAIGYVAGSLTVTPAGLTITADDQTKVYGAALPALTASYSGFVNGDTAASLTTPPTLTTTATAASHVSGNPYIITANGAVDSDYTISYVPGALTVTPAALTITANDQSKAYGAALPTLTASYSGFVNGDTAVSLTTAPTLTTAATAASHVSGNPYTITASGTVDSDYTISYQPGSLTVTPATLTITADDQTKVYGAALPALTASYSGLVNGDTDAVVTTAPRLTTTATAASHVSGNPYTITASGAVADGDYAISYVAGSLTVTPAGLTITADDQTKVYGAALPALTASYSGFVNGDTAANLTTPPTLTTTATAASHVSGNPYIVTANDAVDRDYTISYVPGALTVTPASLTITADDKGKVYGADLPMLTASYSGFVNGDSASSLTTKPTLTTTATAASHVSGNPYTITPSGAVDSDYTISYQPGSLTVTPATLTITADDQGKVYGAGLPTLTASYAGLVNGDTDAVVTTAPTLTTTATTASHVSGNPYTITASGAVADADYAISYLAGSLTVTPAGLTITADDQTKVYGAALPALTASYSGFVNGDTAASLTTPPTLTTTATAASHVSGNPYIITANGAADSDYTISYAPGALTVTPAALTVTADDKTKITGTANPPLTATITGFVNGDTASAVSGAAGLTTTATTASPTGTYPIVAALGTLSDPDYTFGFKNGTLTIATNLHGAFAPKDDLYVIGSGTVSIPAANGVLANDTGPGQLTALAGEMTGAQGGTFVVNADGSFTFTPGSNFPGYDSTRITVSDTSGHTGTETLTVLSQHAGLVWKFYESVLNRAPDPAGLQYWINVLDNGGQTGQIAVGFFESTELLDKIITGYYEDYLLRAPDPVGLSYWVGIWQTTGEPEQIKAGFADSPEFFNSAGGTPQDWITALYQRILDRAPDPIGESYWLGVYQQQTAASVDPATVRNQIALGFFDSAESYTDDVTGWFEEYLFRAPTAVEQAYFQGQMEAGATDRTIEQEITNLQEYANNPPTPAAGTAAELPDYFPTTAQSQTAAKDAFFAGL
ncbi:MAG TPA: MBG domain-containing protein [Pirellulales bacterium]|nr:MBG domain-containing protein [Pirellulales bacterium]